METFRLEPEEQKNLRNMDAAISSLQATIAKMERIGLPVQEQKERLETAIKTRDGMIREFGNPVVPR